MKNADCEVLNLFSAYLAQKLPLADFQEQIALAHWNVEDEAPALSGLVYRAVGKLSELGRGHRTEESLLEELTAAVRPFGSGTAGNLPLRPLLLDLALEFGSIRTSRVVLLRRIRLGRFFMKNLHWQLEHDLSIDKHVKQVDSSKTARNGGRRLIV